MFLKVAPTMINYPSLHVMLTNDSTELMAFLFYEARIVIVAISNRYTRNASSNTQPLSKAYALHSP